MAAALVEEVLLRFPPDDPASLVRAALVCKPWCRLVAGDGFRRRYRVLHRTPPLLGFSYVAVRHFVTGDDRYVTSRFAPATSFRPPRLARGRRPPRPRPPQRFIPLPRAIRPLGPNHGCAASRPDAALAPDQLERRGALCSGRRM